ncbi:MAG: DUF411 domain-containing protein [Pyrinomonadaceae bacterium]|nr:DUF411 domain-containing protein [Pyrinomonadaceae bacterium]
MNILSYKFIVLVLSAFFLIGCTQPPSEATKSKGSTGDKQVSDSPAKPDQELSKAEAIQITVYKSPTCGCCTSWESHLEKAGFAVASKPTEQMTQVKKKRNVPEALHSCHTADVDGYVIEGHVPASDIKKLLEQKPSVLGLAVPGMPQHSPGMQPEGEKPKGFDVLSFDKVSKTAVFSSY